MQLKDHIVLVTGALGTLGSAACEAIAAAGGTPIRSDLAGRGKVDICLDVTREADWTEAMAQIAQTHGRLDGLVNNAGVGTPGDVEQTTFADCVQGSGPPAHQVGGALWRAQAPSGQMQLGAPSVHRGRHGRCDRADPT